jgi:hypothetical protein
MNYVNHTDASLQFLSNHNVKIENSKILSYYYISHENYIENKNSKTSVEYERFRHIRNYVSIIRAINFENVNIVLEYRDMKLEDFDKTELNTSNSNLMNFLLKESLRDELAWVIYKEGNNQSEFTKIHYTMTDLVFTKLDLFNNTRFSLRKKISLKDSIKDKGYYLNSDQELYGKTIDKSYSNMKKLMFSDDFFQELITNFEKYKESSKENNLRNS